MNLEQLIARQVTEICTVESIKKYLKCIETYIEQEEWDKVSECKECIKDIRDLQHTCSHVQYVWDKRIEKEQKRSEQLAKVLLEGFGKYPEKADGVALPIKWEILKVEIDKVLVVSKDCIDCQKYHDKDEMVSWNNSDIRKWLNNTFINAAFSDTEQNNILDKGNGDKIFLLTSEDVTRYWEGKRVKAVTTDYAKAQRGYPERNEVSWWWLSEDNGYNCINGRGQLHYSRKNFAHGIRPALWIKLRDNN